jgi:hypothetical protein
MLMLGMRCPDMEMFCRSITIPSFLPFKGTFVDLLVPSPPRHP